MRAMVENQKIQLDAADARIVEVMHCRDEISVVAAISFKELIHVHNVLIEALKKDKASSTFVVAVINVQKVVAIL